MRSLVLRILKNGVLVALVLAALGYVMAEAGGAYLASQPSANRSSVELNEQAVSALRSRLPLGLAAWGFGLTALFETLGWLVRGNPKPPAAKQVPGTAPSEQLFNDLLKRSEAANPPAAEPCPPAPAAENTPGSS